MATATELPQTGYIRVALLALVLSTSRSTIWRWVKKEAFPQPIKLSAGVTVWRVEDVRAWLETKEVA